MDITIIIVIWVITSGVVSTYFSDREIGSGSVFLLSLFLSPIIGILIGLSSKRKEEVDNSPVGNFQKEKEDRINIIEGLDKEKKLGIISREDELLLDELKKEYNYINSKSKIELLQKQKSYYRKIIFKNSIYLTITILLIMWLIITI